MYPFLLKLYPKTYQKEFGDEMKFVFVESLKDVSREGGRHRMARFWFNNSVDYVKSLVVFHIENQKGGDNMLKAVAVLLIVGFLAVDWLSFHDFLKPGEVYNFREYLTGFLSILVFVCSIKMLVNPNEK